MADLETGHSPASAGTSLLAGNRSHDISSYNEEEYARVVSHVGSLPRPLTSSDLPIRQEAGEAIDTAKLTGQVEIATAHATDKQVEAGVDVGNDGEQSRI